MTFGYLLVAIVTVGQMTYPIHALLTPEHF